MALLKLTHRSSFASCPEWQLILTCARTRLDDRCQSRIRELLLGPLNWDEFVSLASQHGVDALVSRHLSGALSGAVPPVALACLEKNARRSGRWNLLLAGRMVALLEEFRRADVLAVPYKGPTLASLAYGNLALRPSSDLDFAVPQRDLPRAYEVLIAAGFRASLDPAKARDASYLALGNPGQHCFLSEPDLLIELHTEKTLRYFPVPLDWDKLRARLVTVSVGGHPVPTLSLEDTFIFLSVHGSKHFWNRLMWICDLAELAQVPRAIDWEMSERLAAEMGCRRMWLLGLSLANEILDAPLPASVLRSIGGDSIVAALGRRVRSHLFRRQSASPSAPARFFFRLRSYDSLADGSRQCLRMATQPTEEDWRAHALPRWATPLHAVLRPWRLLHRHGLGLGLKPKARTEVLPGDAEPR